MTTRKTSRADSREEPIDGAKNGAELREILAAATLNGRISVGLTEDRRRAVCFHEAGHAVVHALGGGFVHHVAVAPTGAVEWTTAAGKSGPRSDLWGICVTSDSPAFGYIRSTQNGWEVVADRPGFVQRLRVTSQHERGMRREAWRQVRAYVCTTLAGSVAEQIATGRRVEWLDPDGIDDAAIADAHIWLLPPRERRVAFDQLFECTVATLRRPEIWAYVVRLAEALEQQGEIDETIDDFLPAASSIFPPVIAL